MIKKTDYKQPVWRHVFCLLFITAPLMGWGSVAAEPLKTLLTINLHYISYWFVAWNIFYKCKGLVNPSDRKHCLQPKLQNKINNKFKGDFRWWESLARTFKQKKTCWNNVLLCLQLKGINEFNVQIIPVKTITWTSLDTMHILGFVRFEVYVWLQTKKLNLFKILIRTGI